MVAAYTEDDYAEARAKAERGAAFMHEHVPGYWREDAERPIDLGTLDMPDGSDCILGQSCPLEFMTDSGTSNYATYARILSGCSNGYVLNHWADAHGFLVDHAKNPHPFARAKRWAALTDAWRDIITELRKEAADRDDI